MKSRLKPHSVPTRSAPRPDPVRSSSRVTLVLNIGNTSLFGGVLRGKTLRTFRLAQNDLVGLRAELACAKNVTSAVLCSVVPKLTPKIAALVKRATGVTPHVLGADSPHGLKIAYRDPKKLGADRLAAAIGARALFPQKSVIVVDCGTATTVTALTKTGEIAGGAILPGAGLWAEALSGRTAQLPKIRLGRPRTSAGRSPEEAIASGIYFGHLGAVRELVARLRREVFRGAQVVVVGTGGNAPLYAGEKLFTVEEPRLILHGLLVQAGSLSHHA